MSKQKVCYFQQQVKVAKEFKSACDAALLSELSLSCKIIYDANERSFSCAVSSLLMHKLVYKNFKILNLLYFQEQFKEIAKLNLR